MNITFALDDALVAAAKSLAARQNTSVNALVRSALEHQVALGGGDSAAGAASGVLQELLEYSAGSRPRAVAMQALGISDYGLFLRLLNAAGLPHPIVPMSTRRQMADALGKVLAAQATQA